MPPEASECVFLSHSDREVRASPVSVGTLGPSLQRAGRRPGPAPGRPRLLPALCWTPQRSSGSVWRLPPWQNASGLPGSPASILHNHGLHLRADRFQNIPILVRSPQCVVSLAVRLANDMCMYDSHTLQTPSMRQRDLAAADNDVQGKSPVMAKAFEKPFTVRVRGHMPGSAAKEWCCAG